MRRGLAVLGFCALAAPLRAQAFETVSIQPSTSAPKFASQRGELIGWKLDPPIVQAGHVTLPALILRAYEIETSQLQGPIWGMASTSSSSAGNLFDLDAKMPAGATLDQVPAMLRKVLQDRFGLKVHRVQHQTETYALVINDGGFKPPRTDAAIPLITRTNPDGSTHVETPTTAILLTYLAIPLGQTPVDKTGLRDLYAIRVDLPSTTPVASSAMRVAPPIELLSRALETVGLRLERQTKIAESIFVDHVELTPLPN